MAQDDFQRFQSHAIQVGKIAQWDDSKGFGWVECGGIRVFLHIKDFNRRQRRPVAGEELRFVVGIDAKGRSCAKRVEFVKSGGRMTLGSWMILACLMVLPLLAGLFLPVPPWLVPAIMVVFSAITYGLYSHDKQQAVSGGWRVPESSLHLVELLGGWPGAFVAQRRLRHKCSKANYQAVFFCIVVVFQLAAADVICRYRMSCWAMEQVGKVIREQGR